MLMCMDWNFQYKIPLGGSVIIDTDAGIDDAAALLMTLGCPLIKIEAITCVRGNTDVINVAINVQKVLNIAKRHDVSCIHSYTVITLT